MAPQNKISVFGGYGFVLDEFYRQYPDEVIRMEKHEVVPKTNKILYGISTVDNYNVFDSPVLDIETNLIHLMEVLDASQKTFGSDFEFNFISSWFVYGMGSTKDKPFTEQSYTNPTGFYSITKRCAEQLLISYCETFKIKYRILRLANVLGWRDKKVSKKKNALQYILDKLVHNEDIELYDNGNFYRDYIDVRDAVSAIALCINVAGFGEIINISNGESILFQDIIKVAANYSDSKSNIWEKLEIPSFHSIVQTKNVFISNEKLKSLGYKQQYPIEETIKLIIDKYKEV